MESHDAIFREQLCFGLLLPSQISLKINKVIILLLISKHNFFDHLAHVEVYILKQSTAVHYLKNALDWSAILTSMQAGKIYDIEK